MTATIAARPTGSLYLTARRSGTRTVLERIRYDGISRCSRAFARGDAALVVLSQLGPGVVRGDSVTLDGHLRAHAHVVVTAQTGTRLMGGARPAVARAHWALETGALLEVIGEPLIALPDTDYRACTTIDLAPQARVVTSEIAVVPAGASVLLTTVVRKGGREIVYDAVDAAVAAPHVVGTFIAAGFESDDAAALLAALDAAADNQRDADTRSSIRVGIGSHAGGVFARILAADAWSVRLALAELAAAVHDVTSTTLKSASMSADAGRLR